MGAKLFQPYLLKDLELKNRIVMSPMCMDSCHHEDGMIEDWHIHHYVPRAVGQVGTIMVEATAVTAQGRITRWDLGIWSDAHVAGLKRLTDAMKMYGAKTAIQLAHAGRKAELDDEIISSVAVPFKDDMQTPKEMTVSDIAEAVEAFRQGAIRAGAAGFEIIELHGAHGYLINQFLTPVVNSRTDQYGGSPENRFRFLKEVIAAVKTVWDGPLLVRVSAKDYAEGGLEPADYAVFGQWMKELGVDLIDVSSGGVLPVKVPSYLGYQVPFSEEIKRGAGIATGAVGLITSGMQAEEILQKGQADLIFIGRELLRDPYWPRVAAKELGESIHTPEQYKRSW